MANEMYGYDVVVAENGVVGFERVRREAPDFIALDLMMPKQTGMGMCRSLSNSKELRGILTIVISGVSSRYLAVSKPFAVLDRLVDPDEFIASVKRAIGDPE